MSLHPETQLRRPKALRPKGIADVVVCIDCTGSMAPCIEGVKNHVQDLVAGFASYPNIQLDWRVRLLAYRDLNIEEPVEEHPFTKDAETFRAQVQALHATGGGDEPESTLDAIYRALKSEWREDCNRCIVVFTDATTHPELHPSSVEPGQARDVHEVINLLTSLRARLFLYGRTCESYNRLALAPRVEFRAASSLGLDNLDFKEILAYIGKTVSASTTPVMKA